MTTPDVHAADQPVHPPIPEDEIIPWEIETPYVSHPEQPITDRLEERWADPPGPIIGRLEAIQNNVVGGRIMGTAFLFFLVAGVFALIMRAQLIRPENTLVGPQTYNGLFTMHGSTMMYLFVVPMMEGFAIVMLPMLLGNREMPFPRLGVFSYFTFLLGGLLFFSSFLLNTVPDAGWFAYTPLSGLEYSPGVALDYWLLALGVAEVAAIAAGVEIIIMILRMRAPGMSLSRLPLYAWAMLVTAFSILFAFTPLIIASLMLELDRKIGTQFFVPEAGGSPVLWQHLFWIFGHPEVYIQFLPATGMIAMIIPVFSRLRIIGYIPVAMAMVATGFISFALWVHHMFSVGLPEISLGIFSAASILIAIPTGVQIFAYLATLLSGRPVWKTAMLFAAGFLVTFVLGGITGVMVGAVPFDWQAHDSYFVVAHLHYVLIGGSVFPIFAALYYWMPKLTGKLLDERLGRWNFWLMFIGFHVAFFPQHIVGLLGMPRRFYTYLPGLGWDIYNFISTIGAFILAAGIGVFVVNYFYSNRVKERAGRNPWGGDSMEWSTISPPLNFGFSILPIIRGRHPLWDQGEFESGPAKWQRVVRELAYWPLHWRAALVTSTLDAEPQEVIRVSGPSIWPVVAAVGLVTIFGSEIFSLRPVSALGIVILIMGVVGWNWPESGDEAREKERDAEERAFEERIGIPVSSHGSRIVSRSGMMLYLLLLAIATTTFAFSYFYLRLENEAWPPGGLETAGLIWPAVGLVLLLLNAFVVRRSEQVIGEGNVGRLRLWLFISSFLGAGALAALIYDFSLLDFDWRVNAYGSIYWSLGAFLMLMLISGVGINLFNQYWSWRGIYNARRHVAIDNGALYWQAMVVAWLVITAILYVTPYVL